MNERTLRSVTAWTTIYDRCRLFERDVTPTPLTSMRDVNWEHQAAAIKAGYKSVADLAIDELLDMVGRLEARVAALEGGRRTTPLPLVQEEEG